MFRGVVVPVLNLLLSSKRAALRLESSQQLPNAIPFAPRDSAHAELMRWLRSCLRRFPYWPRGQLALGIASIGAGDVPTAYASAHAVLELSTGPNLRNEAVHLLGRCYLARGDAGSALPLLQKAVGFNPGDAVAKEDLVACYMLQENYAEAEKILRTISEDKLSSESRSLLMWLQQKREGAVSPVQTERAKS